MAETRNRENDPPKANEDARRAAEAEGQARPKRGDAGGTYGQGDSGGRGNQGAVKGETEDDRARGR